MRKFPVIVILSLINLLVSAQKDTGKYNRLDELIWMDKRYRIHNNYLTAGGGYIYSTIRTKEQAIIGIDYNFHIKRQKFQAGVLMSGDAFLSNNNINIHLGYGYRIEDEKKNIAFYGGPCFNTGIYPPVITATDTIPARIFENIGIYASAHYIKKIAYDIGIGLEAVIEANATQVYGGIKGVLFFSGAYRGKAKLFNRNVKRRIK